MERFAAWEGVHLQVHECIGWKAQEDIDLMQSSLVLHVRSGRSFGVYRAGIGWKFIARERRFDYYPAGGYELISSGPALARAVAIHIPLAFENAVFEEGRWGKPIKPKFQFQDRRLEGLVMSLFDAGAIGMGTVDAVLLSVSIVDRVSELCQLKQSEASSHFTPTVRRLITEYIDQHIGASIDANRVAFLTGLKNTQFNKKFRQSFDMTLHQYVLARRVKIAAKRLLSDIRITELAHELGFSSHAHFSTVFRQITGKTPGQFRKDNAACKDERRS